MKKVGVIIVIIALLISSFYLYEKFNSKEVSSEETVEKPYENMLDNIITIYDIEEGYLTVKYNSLADRHEYNWDKYLDNSSSFYKYEDNKYKAKIGIDVSEYQGNIDWEKVKKSGIEFAIIRIGYRGYGKNGNIVLDSKFEENYKKAIENGIDVGVYFFSQAINTDEVKEEIDFILKNIEGKEIKYPITFDLEKIKNDTARTDNLTFEEITNMTMEFCKIINNNGYIASIYGNSKTFTTKMKLDLFNDYNKWYADYQKKPLYPYEFNMWQYTETGHVDGIDGNVDINICFVEKK